MRGVKSPDRHGRDREHDPAHQPMARRRGDPRKALDVLPRQKVLLQRLRRLSRAGEQAGGLTTKPSRAGLHAWNCAQARPRRRLRCLVRLSGLKAHLCPWVNCSLCWRSNRSSEFLTSRKMTVMTLKNRPRKNQSHALLFVFCAQIAQNAPNRNETPPPVAAVFADPSKPLTFVSRARTVCSRELIF